MRPCRHNPSPQCKYKWCKYLYKWYIVSLRMYLRRKIQLTTRDVAVCNTEVSYKFIEIYLLKLIFFTNLWQGKLQATFSIAVWSVLLLSYCCCCKIRIALLNPVLTWSATRWASPSGPWGGSVRCFIWMLFFLCVKFIINNCLTFYCLIS